MKFLSNGDYGFPFDWVFYWVKHFYMWSFQAGAPNPDGIIRLPGRVFNLLIFSLFGNVAVGYFYLALCLFIAFFAFWYFASVFLRIKSKSVLFIGALFFAINPIFLGNLSKVGLILAVAMLPFALALLKKWFQTGSFTWLFFAIVCVNISLLHPYTFVVNLIILAAYFLYKIITQRKTLKRNILRLIPAVIIALLLNAYLILPLAGLGTLDKSAILDDVDTSEVDFTRLVDIANTGDLVTGLSLSKNVLKDYEFYDFDYANFYFAGAFIIYIVIFGVYCWVNKRATRTDQYKFLIATAAVLILILLSAVNYFYVGDLIKWLINLPGGWIFRSPLKWQLYIPLFMGVTLLFGLKYLKAGWERRAAIGVLLTCFLAINAYLLFDIYNKLLTPREVTQFQGLQQRDMQYKTMLFVGSTACTDLAMKQPWVMTELNQVLSSKALQVKRTGAEGLRALNLSNFDYVLLCKYEDQKFAEGYNFAEVHSFVEHSIKLFENKEPNNYVFASSNVIELHDKQNIAGKYEFLKKILGRSPPFTFVEGGTDNPPDLQDPFDDMSYKNVHDGMLKGEVVTGSVNNLRMFIKNDKELFARTTPEGLALSTQQLPGSQRIDPGDYHETKVTLPNGGTDIYYHDPAYDYKNTIGNASFEDGMWREKVQNCYQYDRNPMIDAKLTSESKSDGKQSLELSAKRHVACMGTNPIRVDPGARYLLSFDYQGLDGRAAGYSLGFNGTDHPRVSGRLHETEGQWETYSREVVIPGDVSFVDLKLSAYPVGNLGGIARFDNVHLIKIPDVNEKIYFVGSQGESQSAAPEVKVSHIDVTKKTVQVTNASTPFYLVMKDGYHKLWQLSLANGTKTKELNEKHIRADFVSNAWQVDPSQICGSGACQQNADGTYNFILTIEFAPQKMFYIGAIISAVTLLGCVLYIVIRKLRSKPKQFIQDDYEQSHHPLVTANRPKTPAPQKQRRIRIIQ